MSPHAETGIDTKTNPNKPTITITDRSYGIIPMRFENPSSPTNPSPMPTTQNTQLLLIHQKTTDPYITYWGFPKGHAEPSDASILATALRELREETALTVLEDRILVFPSSEVGRKEKVFKETYVTDGRRRGKEVRFWLGLVEGEQEVRVQAMEVVSAEWLSWTEAMKRLTYVEGRRMLKDVGTALDGPGK